MRNSLNLLLMLSLWGVGLSACDSAPTGENVVNNPSLPEVSGTVGDCTVDPYDLHLDEWFRSGDSVIFGTVSAVRPALELAWADANTRGNIGLRDAEDCDVSENGLVIDLVDVAGVALSGERLPSTLSVYLGSSHYREWLYPPTVTETSVLWPEGKGQLARGMRIAALALREESTGRWGIPLERREPIFEVRGDRLHVSSGYQQKCGENAPVTELESMTEATLLASLRAMKVGEEDAALIAERQKHQNAEDASEFRIPGTWFAYCHAPRTGGPVGDECVDNDGCADGEACVDGFCLVVE